MSCGHGPGILMATESAILRFYDGDGTDHMLRTLEEILAWDDWHLEEVHNYIQWVFPLTDPSRANSSAPLLTPDEIAAFRESAARRATLHRAFVRILAFYGFDVSGTGAATLITRSADW